MAEPRVVTRGSAPAAVDEEDIALRAFKSFASGPAGQFTQLLDTENLWPC